MGIGVEAGSESLLSSLEFEFATMLVVGPVEDTSGVVVGIDPRLFEIVALGLGADPLNNCIRLPSDASTECLLEYAP